MYAPGMIMMWGGGNNAIPAGWMVCDGTNLPSEQYPDLFDVIGTNFGANPPTGTFYLPDLRGQFIRGVDTTGVRDPDYNKRHDMHTPSISASGVGSIEFDAFQNHTHSYTVFPATSGGVASGSYWTSGEAQTGLAPDTFKVNDKETRPINAYLYFIIYAGAPTNS